MTALLSGWQHHFISTNNIRLHYVSQGEGELVVLLHGFPEFWYSWRFQIPALARHFKVVVPDLRGYNDSDKPASGYDLDTLISDIRGLIDSLGYAKAYIVGHDWGGAIAWHLAHRCPDYVQRLAILNAPHPYQFLQEIVSDLDQLRRSWYVLAFQLPALPEWLIRQNLKSIIKTLFHDQAVRKSAFSQRDVEIYQAALEKPGVLTAALNYYRQLVSPQTWLRNLGRSPAPVTAPTMILWGEEDAFLKPHLAQDCQRFVVAPFEVNWVSHCGHWVQQEAPQTVNRALLDFFRKE